jgi:hypothetical protein
MLRISIGREDFYEIFMSNQGDEPEYITFLRKCDFIKYWPINVLIQNPLSCLFHYYKYKKYLSKISLNF